MSEDTDTPTIANVADFLELLQSAVIETGPNTGTIDTGINPAYLAECISTLHRAARRLDPEPPTTEQKTATIDALEQARYLVLPSETIEAVAPAQLRATRAAAYAAIAQAEALQRIAVTIEDTFTRGELNVMVMNGQQ